MYSLLKIRKFVKLLKSYDLKNFKENYANNNLYSVFQCSCKTYLYQHIVNALTFQNLYTTFP